MQPSPHSCSGRDKYRLNVNSSIKLLQLNVFTYFPSRASGDRSPKRLTNSKNGLRVGNPAQLILIASKTPYKKKICALVNETFVTLKTCHSWKIYIMHIYTYTTPKLLHNVDILKYSRLQKVIRLHTSDVVRLSRV